MKRFFTFLLAAVAFVACSQHEFEENASIQQNVKQLTVAFEEQTRIKLDKDVKSVWEKGDELSVLFGDKNEKWSYEGESGERTAKLTAPGNSTLEDGEAAMAYPYNVAYSYDAAAKSLDVELPAVQGYAIDSYGANGNLMTAYSTTSNFTLRSVVGWLRLELEGNGEKVQSIEVKGNNGEQVAGKISVDVATAVATLATKAEDKGDKVTLTCGSGVELGAKAKVFYVALPPQNYSKGITATVTFAEGEPYEIVKNAAIEIERNHIKPMSVKVESEPTEPEKRLEDGTYALVVKSGESYFAMACDNVLSGSDKRFSALDITSTFNATSMTVSEDTLVWSLAERAEGGYFVTFNGKYLYGSESDNVAKVGDKENYVTINANGDDTYQLITSAATTEKNLALNTNIDTPAFAFYKSETTSKQANNYATAFYLVPVQFKGIAVEKSSVELTAEAAEGTIAVTVHNISEKIEVASNATWLTVELEGDKLNYSAAANTTSASREAVVTIAAGSIEKEITFTQAPPVTEKRVTVKEFLAAAENDTDYYILSGTITSVKNTTFGNFYLMDDTGTVYIYGLCSPEGKKQYWAESGAKVGDDITVKTLRSSFNGSPQGADAIFVELVSPGTRAFWSFDKTSVTISADGGSQSVAVTGGNWKSEVNVASDNAQFAASYADGVVTITAKANTTKDMINGVVTVTCGTLKQEISVKQPSNSAEVKEFVITFPGNPSAYTNSYTSSFTITLQDTYSFAFAGINNGQEKDAWTAVRMGRKEDPSVATIATEFAVPYAVKSVDVNFTQVKADFEFNEAKLVVATDSEFSNVVEEVEVVPAASGKVSYVVTTPATKYYYKLVYDMPAIGGKSNGVFRIDSVTFVK